MKCDVANNVFNFSYSDILFLFRNHESHSLRLLDVINDPLFWNVFTVFRSPPDGHCFIHSVISSLKSQGQSINVDDLLQLIDFECFDNTHRYLPFMGENSSLLLFQAMHNYTIYRHYDSDFVDLIPQICANALGMYINIVVKHDHRYIFYRLTPISHTGNFEVYVLKNGDHYDSLITESRVCLDGAARSPGVSDCSTQSVCSQLPKDPGIPGNQASGTDECNTNEFSLDSQSVSDLVSLTQFGICFYNIHGLTLEKLSDDMLGLFFKKFSLILLCETWLAEAQTDDFDVLDGYSFYNLHRKYRHPNAIRDSGGLGIYVKKEFEHGIEFTSKLDDIITTMKLRKEVFSLPVDIYISNCYIVPINSSHMVDDPFILVQQELAKIPSEGGSITFLDSNAHTNVTNDFSIDSDGSNGSLEELLPSDSSYDDGLILDLYRAGRLDRISTDCRPLNPHGHDFVDMCRASRKLILNSRLPGNDLKQGKATHYNPDGTSGVLDYAISSPNLFEFITRFDVHDKFPESDHCPISVEFPIDMSHTPPSNTLKSNSHVDWGFCNKFIWEKSDLPRLEKVFEEKASCVDYISFKDSISCNEDPDKVARLFSTFFIKSCKSILRTKKSRKLRKRKYRQINFFDKECKQKRIEAIKAGARVITHSDQMNLISKTKAYKACIQRKKRNKKNEQKNKLKQIFEKDAASIWAELNNTDLRLVDEGLRYSFLSHFENLGVQTDEIEFDETYLSEVESFLKEYDCNQVDIDIDPKNNHISPILNQNFTIEEVEYAIGCLKNKKSPGTDSIPAEFIKFCKSSLLPDLHQMYNFILEKREFPKSWAEGLKSAVFKSGLRNNPNNYRGITVLGIFAKIFEILVSNRFHFVNDAFDKIDKNNGGFLKGKRTTDNIFILTSLIQRQLSLGKSLYVCFVDFSKAFDLVNRAVLFYKLINSGWSGRLLDTVRDFYSKTSFRFKFQGEVSPNIPNNIGVNQGGNASGFLFRKYISDLGDFLHKQVGICMGDTILSHLLWADDLILFSDSLSGIQKQLDGLYGFCSKNRMIVNELKTKIMVFGRGSKGNITFNGKLLDWVEKYKYLGNIINSVKQMNGDIFKENSSYLCNKARGAIFSFFKRIKSYGTLPPNIMVSAYKTLVQPILLYGSDVWGTSKSMCNSIDKVCLFFIRCILRVKRSTSKLMCFGELGIIPPSVLAKINVLNFYLRLKEMNSNSLESVILDELCDLRDVGFPNILSKVQNIALSYNINLDVCNYSVESINALKQMITCDYKQLWHRDIHDNNSSLRLYKSFKSEYVLEPYLSCINIDRHRQALSKFRCSSHFLEIERARHQNRIPPIWERNCLFCPYAVDDELHLLLYCSKNRELRVQFLNIVFDYHPEIAEMHHLEQFASIMASQNHVILQALGKYIFESFKIRNI